MRATAGTGSPSPRPAQFSRPHIWGLAYSFYPYVVPNRLTIYEAASAPESLMIILVGACFVVPAIIGYSILAYVVFRGKAADLRYD